MEIIVIGGGLVGLATALHLKRARPELAVRLLEKEGQVGPHQSSHNSGVLHAGLYYRPGSLKARLAVEGIRKMTAFCQEQGVRHDVCGKVVVATEPDELPRLHALLERGRENGLRGLRLLSPDELREIEPHAAGLAAVHVPEEGIVDYLGVCAAMEREIRRLGGEIVLSAEVRGLKPEANGWRVLTRAGDWPAGFVINCAGLHSDRLAGLAGVRGGPKIVPFRGQYHRLKPSAATLVRNLIYPVPDPVFPFLGVHFTRMIGGGVEAGPNAMLAMTREGYSKWDINPRDLAEAVLFPGIWRFMNTHRKMAWAEISQTFSRRRFCQAMQKLVPEVREDDLEEGGSGVRAQAMLADGTLVQDFSFAEDKGILHVLNAPSPAATASLAIGEHVAGRCLERLP